MAGWDPRQESARRSEPIKPGLARRPAQGKPMSGAAPERGEDRQPRRSKGYQAAWA